MDSKNKKALKEEFKSNRENFVKQIKEHSLDFFKQEYFLPGIKKLEKCVSKINNDINALENVQECKEVYLKSAKIIVIESNPKILKKIAKLSREHDLKELLKIVKNLLLNKKKILMAYEKIMKDIFLRNLSVKKMDYAIASAMYKGNNYHKTKSLRFTKENIINFMNKENLNEENFCFLNTQGIDNFLKKIGL